jgi:hypothetical protein
MVILRYTYVLLEAFPCNPWQPYFLHPTTNLSVWPNAEVIIR